MLSSIQPFIDVYVGTTSSNESVKNRRGKLIHKIGKNLGSAFEKHIVHDSDNTDKFSEEFHQGCRRDYDVVSRTRPLSRNLAVRGLPIWGRKAWGA